MYVSLASCKTSGPFQPWKESLRHDLNKPVSKLVYKCTIVSKIQVLEWDWLVECRISSGVDFISKAVIYPKQYAELATISAQDNVESWLFIILQYKSNDVTRTLHLEPLNMVEWKDAETREQVGPSQAPRGGHVWFPVDKVPHLSRAVPAWHFIEQPWIFCLLILLHFII
jgi:hypothetical protein